MTHIIYAIAFSISLSGCYLVKQHARCGFRKIRYGQLFKISYQKYRIWDYMLIALPPILLLALRYGIGGDYYNYESFYEQYINSGSSQFEPLAEAIMSLNNYIFGNYQCFLALVATMTFLLIVNWCVKLSDSNSLPLTIGIMYCFYFGNAMNTVFQILAASIILYAFYYAQQKNIIKFLVTVVIAALIHSSALVVLPLYFVILKNDKKEENNRYNDKTIIKIWGILMISTAFAYIFTKYGALYKIAYSGYIGKYSEGGMINVYLKLAMLLYIPELWFMRKLLKTSKKYELYYILVVLEMVCYTMSINIAYAFRMAYYFSFAHAIIIPAIIKNCVSAKSKIIVRIYFIIVLLFWFIFTTYICKYNGINEYKSIIGL